MGNIGSVVSLKMGLQYCMKKCVYVCSFLANGVVILLLIK